MPSYPLIFGFRELVAGNGFVAGVAIEGRALLKSEDDGAWWVYGVEPGGVSDGGSTELEAYQTFRESFREVLHDSAALTKTFEEFKADVESLSAQVNGAWESEWQAARSAIRAGELKPQGGLVGDLPKETKDVRASVTVVRLPQAGQEITPKDNSAELELLTAA